MFLVTWDQIDYNIGNYFNGYFNGIFSAPENGLYSFCASAQRKHNGQNAYIYIYVNRQEKIRSGNYAQNSGRSNCTTSLLIQTTLKLDKGDNIEVRLEGTMYEPNHASKFYFEGRLVSKIDD